MTKEIETKKEAAFVVPSNLLEKKKNFCWALFTRCRGEVTGNFLLLGFQTEPEKEKWGRKLASDLSPSQALIH